MPYARMLYEIDGPIAYLTFNRPEALNAIDLEMGRDICRAMEDVALDDDVRVAVIAGAGRAWSAGHDLKQHDDEPITTALGWRPVLKAVARIRDPGRRSRAKV